MKPLKIGEVAKIAATGIETIRFYEREGLLLEPERRPSGYRQYDASIVERLDYIRRAKELGFTLAEIRELLELSFDPANCEHVRQRADAKIADIESKIRNLRQMKRALRRILDRCRNRATADCPLVHRSRTKPVKSPRSMRRK